MCAFCHRALLCRDTDVQRKRLMRSPKVVIESVLRVELKLTYGEALVEGLVGSPGCTGGRFPLVVQLILIGILTIEPVCDFGYNQL